MRFTAFNRNQTDKLKDFMFLGAPNNILRFDVQKFPIFDRLVEKQLSFFWRAEEIDITRDKRDFEGLAEHEKHIFVSNLRLQTLADSMAGRAISVATISAVSLPELEVWYELVAGWESAIHAKSYTHIIRNVFNNPSEIFDGIMDIPEVVDRARQMGDAFDELIEYASMVNLFGFGTHTINGKEVVLTSKGVKRLLYLGIVALYILEGIRFYASFACSFAFVERELMEGNGKIIKLIARDENLHAAGGSAVINIWRKGMDDPEMWEILLDCDDEVREMFATANTEEKAWAKYLFKDGSLVGLNEDILCDYVDELTDIRMRDIGLDVEGEVPATNISKVLPWMHSYISSDSIQIAPQEAEMASYLTASIDGEMPDDFFKKFTL